MQEAAAGGSTQSCSDSSLMRLSRQSTFPVFLPPQARVPLRNRPPRAQVRFNHNSLGDQASILAGQLFVTLSDILGSGVPSRRWFSAASRAAFTRRRPFYSPTANSNHHVQRAPWLNPKSQQSSVRASIRPSLNLRSRVSIVDLVHP